MDAEATLESCSCDRDDVHIAIGSMRSYLAEHPRFAAEMLTFVSAADKEPREQLEQLFGLPAFA